MKDSLFELFDEDVKALAIYSVECSCGNKVVLVIPDDDTNEYGCSDCVLKHELNGSNFKKKIVRG